MHIFGGRGVIIKTGFAPQWSPAPLAHDREWWMSRVVLDRDHPSLARQRVRGPWAQHSSHSQPIPDETRVHLNI